MYGSADKCGLNVRICPHNLYKQICIICINRFVPIICINFQVVFFENNFRKFGTLDEVCEEIIKLHILFSSQMQFFQVNWRLLSLLSIFQLLVK